MADLKISQLTAISVLTPATDVLPVVDSGGVTKKITTNQILGSGGTATLASATITGDLTVDTSTLKVDSTNDNVIVGATSAIGGGRFSVQADLSAKQAICAKNSAASYSATSNFIRFTNSTDSTVGGITHPAVTSLGVWGVSDIQFLLSGAGSTAMTLNSTGLGVGLAATAAKLEIGGGDGTQFYIRSTGTVSARIRGFTNSTEAGLIAFLNGGGIAFDVSGERARIDTSGNLLVGTTTTSGNAGGLKLSNVAGNLGQITFSNNSGSSDYVARFNWGSTPTLVGNITVSSGGTAFNTTSDYRLKESVQPLLGGLARVNALKPSVYKWKTDGSNGEGFLAHELAEVVPAAVTGDKDAVNEDGSIKPQGVDLSKVVPILVAAIKELTARVQTLEAR